MKKQLSTILILALFAGISLAETDLPKRVHFTNDRTAH